MVSLLTTAYYAPATNAILGGADYGLPAAMEAHFAAIWLLMTQKALLAEPYPNARL